jgi:hypothetical protein
VKVDLDDRNRVYHFTNSCVPVALMAKAEKRAPGKPLGKDAALDQALAARA